jgi:hypothetical protein
MSTFSINQAASTEIQRIFSLSNCPDPVAQLYDRAGTGHLFDEVQVGLASGTETTEELKAIARKRFGDVADEVRQLEFSLMVGAAERAKFTPDRLHEVSGITFVMEGETAARLGGYCLTFEHGRFFFIDADGKRHNLRSSLAPRSK